MLYFTIQNRLQDRTEEGLRSGGCEMTILSSDYPRIMVESSFYWRKHFREFPLKSWASRFRGRRSIWWGWRVTLLAPRIGNDVSYVTQIIDDIHFAWQAQYLVRLEGDFTCSAHWKWRFICDADHRWHWFAWQVQVFGEVCRLILLAARIGNDVSYVMRIIDWHCSLSWQAQYLVQLAGDFSWQAQHFVSFMGDSREMLYFTIQNRLQDRTGKVSKAAGARWRFYRRISSDYGRIVFLYWRKHFREFLLKSWASSFRGRRSIWWGWRVTLLAPAHWKWRFICDADHWWHSFCVAGAVFGEVGGWLYLLPALEMTFYMWRRSLMTFILRGRRSIWWSWRVTLVAPRIVNDVSK